MIKRNATLACTLFPSPVLAYIQIYRSSPRFMPDRVKREAEERFVYARPIFLSNGYFISHTFWHSRQMRRKKRGVWTLPRETRRRSCNCRCRFDFHGVSRLKLASYPLKWCYSHQPRSLISKPIKISNFPSTLNNHHFFFFFSFLRARGCIPRQHARLLLALSLI